jgi:hypothetical protein
MEPVYHDNSDEPLLRAIDELRALEEETRRHPQRSEPYLQSVERLQSKSREVFRLAGDDWPDDPSGSAPEPP